MVTSKRSSNMITLASLLLNICVCKSIVSQQYFNSNFRFQPFYPQQYHSVQNPVRQSQNVINSHRIIPQVTRPQVTRAKTSYHVPPPKVELQLPVRPSQNEINYFERPPNTQNAFGNTERSDMDRLEKEYFDSFLTLPEELPEEGAASGSIEDPLLVTYREPLNRLSQLCPKGSFFASYNPSHKTAVSQLAAIYITHKTFQSLLNVSDYFQRRREVHPKVWYSAIIQAQARSLPFTMSMRRPSPIEIFPTSFFPDKLMKQSTLNPQECVVLDGRFGRDNGIENILWYFREDIQLNAHHWIWHLIYPGNSTTVIDRRGEFFYFFHHELIARYVAERLSNNLQPQTPLNIKLDSVIEEGYNPHLVEGISSSNWAERPPMQQLSSVLNSTVYGDLANLVRDKDRLLKSIFDGRVMDRNGDFVPLHSVDSINLLGEISEASDHSINPTFYGMVGYHNTGHCVLSNIVRTGTQEGAVGVMGHVATAMRDPIFYRWHRFVDSVFAIYKAMFLRPYELQDGEHALVVNGITVDDIRVIANNSENSVNSLRTYWNSRRFNLKGGLDYNANRINVSNSINVNVCAKHLDHEEFAYEINIDNNRRFDTLAVVRVYMAPRYKSARDTTGYTMEAQRHLFFTMDSFTTQLTRGRNTIVRRSVDSTVTAPWPKSVEQLQQEIRDGVRGQSDCDCGFPHHLLLPKGTDEGMVFDLFVMVTDGKKDIIVDRVSQNQSPRIEQCLPSHVHCGIQGENYPDQKPMGYPFDRRLFTVPNFSKTTNRAEVPSLEEYVRYIPNSATTQITIVHEDVQRGLENYNAI